jgi:hypothetical protein
MGPQAGQLLGQAINLFSRELHLRMEECNSQKW